LGANIAAGATVVKRLEPTRIRESDSGACAIVCF
jgi:hypothetical protein